MNYRDASALGVRLDGVDSAPGTPLLVASVLSESRLGRLNTFVFMNGVLVPAQSYTWPLGRLEHLRAAHVTAMVGDQLYNRMVQYVGIQEAIQVAP